MMSDKNFHHIGFLSVLKEEMAENYLHNLSYGALKRIYISRNEKFKDIMLPLAILSLLWYTGTLMAGSGSWFIEQELIDPNLGKQCCGFICFWAFWSGSSSQRYGSGSGSFYHQAKILRKTLIPTVLWLLFDFLSLNNDLNVPSKRISRKTYFF